MFTRLFVIAVISAAVLWALWTWAQRVKDPKARRCLYCDRPATSREHFIPAGLGGRLARTILCRTHNGVVERECDKHLITQFEFITHALKVERDRRGRGRAITMRDASGKPYRVDEEHMPHPPTGAIQRDDAGKPRQIVASSRERAESIMETMEDMASGAVIKERREPAPVLETSIAVGGENGFRGILKIAYEFVRYQSATVVDMDQDQKIRETILGSGTPPAFVKWLPYDMYSHFDTPIFCHHVLAWQHGTDVYVLVELFNAYPYAVRLPGLQIERSVLYVQGIQGQAAHIAAVSAVPWWRWADIPRFGQREMLSGLEERLRPLLTVMYGADLLELVCETVSSVVRSAGPDEAIDSMVSNVSKALSVRIGPEGASGLNSFVKELVTLMQENSTRR